MLRLALRRDSGDRRDALRALAAHLRKGPGPIAVTGIETTTVGRSHG